MEAYIYQTLRTPRGAGSKKRGALKDIEPIELLRILFHELQQSRGLDPHLIEDILLGCVTQVQDQGANLAKIAATYAGWPDSASGATVNRFCASGLDACVLGACKVKAGAADAVVTGGVESTSRVPMFSDQGPWFANQHVSQETKFLHMGLAADLLATLDGWNREQVDQIGLESHRRAVYALEEGYFNSSLVPVNSADDELLLKKDQLPNKDATLESFAAFKPSFEGLLTDGQKTMIKSRYPETEDLQHVHHRGNSPALADGAALLVIGSKEFGEAAQLQPRARIVSMADHAVEPMVMLTGSIESSRKALKRASMTAADIDLFEVNEAFAAMVLSYLNEMDISSDQLNVNGGAIALGHALGATGAILLMTLLDELERQDKQTGLVSISGGAGVGSAMIIERV